MLNNFLGFIVCFLFVQESPRFLLANRRFEKLFFNLKKLANYNGKLLRYNLFMQKYEAIKTHQIDLLLTPQNLFGDLKKTTKVDNNLFTAI